MISPDSERALILAPRGRDGMVAASILGEARIESLICESVDHLIAECASGAGFAVVTDEALQTADQRGLSEWLQAQPSWSDLPFVLLTQRGGGLERNPAAKRHLDVLGNVTFIERPFHPTTLVSMAQSALRARRRQYEARKRLEELHENERQLRTLADSIPTLCWMAEADGHIFWYNQQWYDYTGKSPEEMEGWGWQSVHDPEVLPSVMERWQASIATGTAFEMVFPLRSAAGGFRAFLTRVQPLVGADGRVVRWVGTNTDISVQQQAEQVLRDQAAQLEQRVAERTAELHVNERRLRAMFETSFVFQCLITTDGLIADANTASLNGIHADLATVVGQPLWDTSWVSGTPELAEAVQRRFIAVAEGETLRREIAVNLPTGRRTFDLSLRPMFDDAETVTAVMLEAMDITERRQAEEALRQSQKLEAIGQLTGGVAHDFNNLLMPILGALDLLQRRYSGKLFDARAGRMIDGALQSAERAKTLVQRLLGFARRQALDTRAVNLAVLLQGVQDLLKSSIGANIELVLDLHPDAPDALVDPNQLELALLNLCVNARDAMPDGGVLTITVASERVRTHGQLSLEPGEYARLSLTDTGHGMDSETLARAIEPFFSTKPTGRGTGLGLSMVHGLAAQLGGAFTLKSAPGQGVTASLYLPRATSASVGGAMPLAAGTIVTDRALSILLVDDEELVRAGTADMLRDLGHEVVAVGGGSEALGHITDDCRFDLLITDYKMPRMNGAQLAEKIKIIKPDMPILLITGYTGVEEEAPDLMRLAKPFRQADLAEALIKIAA